MGKTISLEGFKTEKDLKENFWDPNFTTLYYEADIPKIKKTKEEMGKVLGLDFIERLIECSGKKKTLLGKQWEKSGKLPIYILCHFDKMSIEEFQEALKLLNKKIPNVKVSIKKDLFIIRNYILNKINGKLD